MNIKISEFISIDLFYEQDDVEKILQELPSYLIRRCAVYLMKSTDYCRFTKNLQGHSHTYSNACSYWFASFCFNLKRIMCYPFENCLDCM